jgi:hypothetical protein
LLLRRPTAVPGKRGPAKPPHTKVQCRSTKGQCGLQCRAANLQRISGTSPSPDTARSGLNSRHEPPSVPPPGGFALGKRIRRCGARPYIRARAPLRKAPTPQGILWATADLMNVWSCSAPHWLALSEPNIRSLLDEPRSSKGNSSITAPSPPTENL